MILLEVVAFLAGRAAAFILFTACLHRALFAEMPMRCPSCRGEVEEVDEGRRKTGHARKFYCSHCRRRCIPEGGTPKEHEQRPQKVLDTVETIYKKREA